LIKTAKQLIALLTGTMLAASCTSAQAEVSAEYEVKAAFIHNIAKFIEWPVAHSRGPLRLCILGQSPFGGALDSLQGKAIGDKVWAVSSAQPDTDLRECGVLFIAASERSRLGRILDGIKGSAVLTMGDSEGYAGQGVMINFYIEQNRVRFEINKDAVGRAGLKVSSHLLKLARIISEEGGGK
jgi:hypothetical protein